MYARHGDLIFKPTNLESLTKRYGQPTKAKDFVVAIGESTGHAHRLRGEADIFGSGAASAVAVKEPTEVTHEDHGSITLEPGAYDIGQERTFDQSAERAYAVSD